MNIKAVFKNVSVNSLFLENGLLVLRNLNIHKIAYERAGNPSGNLVSALASKFSLNELRLREDRTVYSIVTNKENHLPVTKLLFPDNLSGLGDIDSLLELIKDSFYTMKRVEFVSSVKKEFTIEAIPVGEQFFMVTNVIEHSVDENYFCENSGSSGSGNLFTSIWLEDVNEATDTYYTGTPRSILEGCLYTTKLYSQYDYGDDTTYTLHSILERQPHIIKVKIHDSDTGINFTEHYSITQWNDLTVPQYP